MRLLPNDEHLPDMNEPDDNKVPQLVGIGLDCKDGHKRMTRSEDFMLVGGSEETHERMTETMVKTMEQLNNDNKNLREIEADELKEYLERNTPR